MSRARIYHFLFSKHLLFQYILVNNLIFSAQLNFDFKKIRTATTIKRESDKFDYIFKKKSNSLNSYCWTALWQCSKYTFSFILFLIFSCKKVARTTWLLFMIENPSHVSI